MNIVRDAKLKVIAESFRDWGRDCWCPSGIDNTCNALAGSSVNYPRVRPQAPTAISVTPKPWDPQAAIGRVQLKRLPKFVEARKQNWETLRRGLASLEQVLGCSSTHATGWDPGVASAGMKQVAELIAVGLASKSQ